MTVHVSKEFEPTRRMWYFLVMMTSPILIYRLFDTFYNFELSYLNDLLLFVVLSGFMIMMCCAFGFRDFLHLCNLKYAKSEFTNITKEEYLKEKALQSKDSG